MDDCTDGHLKIATKSILKMGFFLLIVRIANVLTELNVIPITLIKVNNYKVQSRFHRYEILPILESRRDNEEDYFFFFFTYLIHSQRMFGFCSPFNGSYIFIYLSAYVKRRSTNRHALMVKQRIFYLVGTARFARCTVL